MPRDTEGRRSAHHAAPASTERDINFEAEHRPDVARRASTTAMRRGATASAGTGHGAEHASETTHEQPHQRPDDPDTASFSGLESAIVLCAKRLLTYAHEIHANIIEPTNEAGIAPYVDAIRQRIELASDELHQLNTRIGDVEKPASGMPHVHAELHPALGQLDMATSRVHIAAGVAQQYVSRHGEPLGAGKNLKKLDDLMKEIHEKLVPHPQDTPPPKIELRFVDERSVANLTDDAMKENLTAIIEAARSVRMSLATGKDDQIVGDIRKVIRHTGEVATLLTQITDNKVLQKFRGRGQQAVRELDGLETDLAGKPQFSEPLHQFSFPAALSDLRARFGARR